MPRSSDRYPGLAHTGLGSLGLVVLVSLATACVAPFEPSRVSSDAAPGTDTSLLADAGPTDARALSADAAAEVHADAADTADAAPAPDATFPPLLALPLDTWVRVATAAPNNTWEHGLAYDGVTRRWIQAGGHVLGGYPQSSYTIAFDPWSAAFSLSTAPRRPQRMCLVDLVYADGIEQLVLSQGSVEHGSLSTGALSADALSIDWTYRRRPPAGPWLYDARADRWEDARLVGETMGSRFHSQLAYDSGSDVVAYLLDTALSLYSPRQNRAWRRALPEALHGRRSYGIAADPDAGRFYVFGGSTQSPESFWAGAADVAAAYDAQVRDDLWSYELATDRWTRLDVSPPPRGMPTIDFLRVPLVYHAPSRSLLTLVTGTRTYVPGGYAAWPAPELWRFDLDAQTWSLHPTRDVPRFAGLLRVATHEDRLFMLGGGDDGEGRRPSLSRQMFALALSLSPRRPAPPRAPEVSTSTGAAVALRFVVGEAVHVYRAPSAESPGPEVQLSAVPITDGRWLDTTAQPRTAYVYRLRRVGEAAASAPVFTQPERPRGLEAEVQATDRVVLRWSTRRPSTDGFHVYRARGHEGGRRVTTAPLVAPEWVDTSPGLDDGIIRRYWVTAVAPSGLESGPSPQAYSVPDAPSWLEARPLDATTVELSWSAPPGLGVDVYYQDRHLNTLSLPGAEIDAWVAGWTKVTPAPVTSGRWVFTIPEASRGQPHAYFFARAVNTLGQAGFITDLTSPRDRRFAPATPTEPAWPRR